MITEHTKLINCFIGLTKKDPTLPNDVREQGYQVDSIEPSFRNEKSEEIHGDLLLNSRKINHGMILECKGGNDASGYHLDKQVAKYKLLKKEDVLSNVSTSESTKFSFDVTFVFSEKAGHKMQDYEVIGNSFPVIIKKENSIDKSPTHGNFKVDQVNVLFSRGITLPNEIPTKYYPFGCSDPLTAIAPVILQNIVHLARKKSTGFTEEDILSRSHPMWESFDEHHKSEMKKKLISIMNLPSFSKIKEHIKKTKEGFKLSSRSYQSLQETCDKIREDIQKVSEQKKLF